MPGKTVKAKKKPATRKRPSRPDEWLIAAVCHEAMRQFRAALCEPPLPAWSEADEDMRASTLEGVRFRLENPDAPVSAQHDQWFKNRTEAGWVYGKVKDTERKKHPSLVPYRQLPMSEKQKDRLFAAIVGALSGSQ